MGLLSQHGRGLVLLVLASLLWGTSYVATKGAVADSPPSVVVAGRFAIASLCFLPFIRWRKALLLAGGELGLWLLLGYGTQTIGLQYTTAGRSAFIASLYVVMVPFVLRVGGRYIGRLVWVAIALAFAGISLLSYQATGSINLGDLWSLGTAVFWSIYIVRLEICSRHHGSLPLTAAQVMGIGLLSLGWVAWQDPQWLQPQQLSTGVPWLAVGYLALASTAIPTWLQTAGQRYVSAPEAVVVFTLEPVAAVFFAYGLLGEVLTLREAMGALLILGATLLSQWPAIHQKMSRQPPEL